MKQTSLASGFLSFLRFLRKCRAGRQAGVHRSRECLLPFPPSKSFRVPMRQQDNRILQYLSLSLSLSQRRRRGGGGLFIKRGREAERKGDSSCVRSRLENVEARVGQKLRSALLQWAGSRRNLHPDSRNLTAPIPGLVRSKDKNRD